MGQNLTFNLTNSLEVVDHCTADLKLGTNFTVKVQNFTGSINTSYSLDSNILKVATPFSN